MVDCSQSVIVKPWKRTVMMISTYHLLIYLSSVMVIGSIHSVLKLDSRHFGVVAASEYKSLGTKTSCC